MYKLRQSFLNMARVNNNDQSTLKISLSIYISHHIFTSYVSRHVAEYMS